MSRKIMAGDVVIHKPTNKGWFVMGVENGKANLKRTPSYKAKPEFKAGVPISELEHPGRK